MSNVRPDGLPYAEAARRIDWLAREALARGGTGVALKDESEAELRLQPLQAPSLPEGETEKG